MILPLVLGFWIIYLNLSLSSSSVSISDPFSKAVSLVNVSTPNIGSANSKVDPAGFILTKWYVNVTGAGKIINSISVLY